MKTKNFFITLLLISFLMQSCNWFKTEIKESLKTGWNFDTENTAKIEDDVALPGYFNSSNSSGQIPKSIDLTKYFPPIGDQGQYGTCVAWAVGYNHKSFLEAKVNGRTNYTATNQIFSPKDLFWAIDNSKKGDGCGGTNFEVAYDIIQNRGIATMNTVPYEDLGDCSENPKNTWTSEAGKHKIQNYREISIKDPETIKKYLAEERAVAFGAKLGDEFMNYTSGVLNYQSYGYTGQHAYHAMILGGYDDNKNAFKVVNSWGKNWGDNGIAWVDYNFFCSGEFCFCAFVATDTQTEPNTNDDNEIVDDPTSGYDIVAWELQDKDYKNSSDPDANDPLWRTTYYNVHNAGDQTLTADKDWSVVYMLYDAYDANNYQIILFDYYSNDFGNKGQNGDIEKQTNGTSITKQFKAQGYWWNYVDVKSKESITHAVFGKTTPFEWTYKMPQVTGDYYLVIYADAFNTFNEANESNNYAYFTAPNDKPLHIENGIIKNVTTKGLTLKTTTPYKGQNIKNQTVTSKNNRNAYTTTEISAMLHHDMETGKLQKKILEYTVNKKTSKNKTAYTK